MVVRNHAKQWPTQPYSLIFVFVFRHSCILIPNTKKDPEILILDESTSALDKQTEHSIVKEIFNKNILHEAYLKNTYRENNSEEQE